VPHSVHLKAPSSQGGRGFLLAPHRYTLMGVPKLTSAAACLGAF